MKKLIGVALIVLLGFGSVFLACSEKKEAPSEKGAIEKMTEKTGKELADKLSAPIDKARKAAEQEENRANEMMETAND